MVEMLVVVAILLFLAFIFLAFMFLPRFAKAAQARAFSDIDCCGNLKQINLSFLLWAGDNNNKFPMEVSVANGGAKELIATGNVAACFQIMSNELSTPKILVCPADYNRVSATDFGNDFNTSHISYFIGVDADTNYPQRFLSGDDNFQMNGSVVKSGLLQYPTHTPITWGPGRHGDVPVHHFWTPKQQVFFGNIGFADGSVSELSSAGLQESFLLSGMATNRLAIP